MKIVMLTNNYLPHVSGVATSIRRLMRNLELRGHEAHLIAPFPSEKNEDIRCIHRVPALPLPEPLIPLPLPIKFFAEKIINNIQPDILHVHHPFLLGKTALRIAKKKHIPIVFTYHSMYEQYVHYVPLVSGIEKLVLNNVMRFANQVDAVVAPSQSVADIIRKRGLKKHVEVIPTGINPDFFKVSDGSRETKRAEWGIKDDEIVIFSFARLGSEKSFDKLIQTFALLEKEHDNLKLVIGGEGPEKVPLMLLAKKLQVGDKVIFTGEIPHEEVPLALCGADIFAYFSMSETQGLVTLEALAGGLPAVVTNAPGNRDIVEHDKNGFVVNPEPKILAEALNKLINNELLREKFSVSARQRAKEFSERNMGQRMEKLYTDCLNGHQKA